jgi:hypothetical protein
MFADDPKQGRIRLGLNRGGFSVNRECNHVTSCRKIFHKRFYYALFRAKAYAAPGPVSSGFHR